MRRLVVALDFNAGESAGRRVLLDDVVWRGELFESESCDKSQHSKMLEVFLVITFTGHLVAVNVAAAGPLYCVAVEWWGRRRCDVAAQKVARRLAVWSLVGSVVGMVIGGALLAILSHTDWAYWSALGRVPVYRWWFFGGEVVFYFVCMIPYVVLWERAGGRRWWHRLLAVLAATNLLYHFPPLFTMLSLMSTRPELAGEALDRLLYMELFTDPETLARVAHHWLSSLATTGVVLILLATRAGAASGWTAVFAARVALAATVVQLPVGAWLLLVSPAGAQSQLLGGEMASTVLFGMAIFFMVLLLVQLAAAAFGDDSRATAIKSAILLLAVLLLMSAVLHRTRAERFGRAAEPGGGHWRSLRTIYVNLTVEYGNSSYKRPSVATTRLTSAPI